MTTIPALRSWGSRIFNCWRPVWPTPNNNLSGTEWYHYSSWKRFTFLITLHSDLICKGVTKVNEEAIGISKSLQGQSEQSGQRYLQWHLTQQSRWFHFKWNLVLWERHNQGLSLALGLKESCSPSLPTQEAGTACTFYSCESSSQSISKQEAAREWHRRSPQWSPTDSRLGPQV
jgi:hypothetical protein